MAPLVFGQADPSRFMEPPAKCSCGHVEGAHRAGVGCVGSTYSGCTCEAYEPIVDPLTGKPFACDHDEEHDDPQECADEMDRESEELDREASSLETEADDKREEATELRRQARLLRGEEPIEE